MAKTRYIPDGYSTVTPAIIMRDAKTAIEFYKKAFGAKEHELILGPDNKVMHAEILIGSSIVMLGDEMMGYRSAETIGGSPIGFYVYVEDVDSAFERALAAGAKQTVKVSDQFWGDRMGQVEDPFGYKWYIATRIKDLTKEEILKGQEEWMKQVAAAK